MILLADDNTAANCQLSDYTKGDYVLSSVLHLTAVLDDTPWWLLFCSEVVQQRKELPCFSIQRMLSATALLVPTGERARPKANYLLTHFSLFHARCWCLTVTFRALCPKVEVTQLCQKLPNKNMLAYEDDYTCNDSSLRTLDISLDVLVLAGQLIDSWLGLDLWSVMSCAG